MKTSPTVILETERMRLQRPVMEEVDAYYALYSDKETRQYFPDGTDGTLTYDETKEEVEWFLNGHPRYPELGLWSTYLKETNEFIGRSGLLPWTLDGQDEVEVAYLIDKRYWRQGLGTEAALAIRDYAFNELGLTRLVCMIDPNNEASKKVAEHMGMSLEKGMEDETGPFLLYSLEKQLK
jgi:RimJ/RimL family protein N-acetyltransferase